MSRTPSPARRAAVRLGHLVSQSVVHTVWARARAKIGRADLRLHDLRHTAAMLAASTGATTSELQSRLGHATPDAALRYQHAAAGADALTELEA